MQILRYILKRLAILIPVALMVVTIVALLIHFVPGDPVDRIVGDYSTPEVRQAIREQLNLDKPFLTQIGIYYKNVLKGDLGTSLIYNQPVKELIIARALPTVELALLAILISIAISIPLGVLSAIKANSSIDLMAMGFALLGVAIPNFWLGPMLILLFSLHLNLLPVSGRTDIYSYILPAITLGTALAAILSRMTRTTVLENLAEDYVKTAKSKGLNDFDIIFKHVLKNASLPLVTVIGLQFGVLLTGAIVTERIFDWPGLGSLMIAGIDNRDFVLVQGLVLVFSFTYLLVNLLTDITYAMLDPRIRLK